MPKYGRYMSWFARFVNRSMSEQHPEVYILTEENTSMILNGERKISVMWKHCCDRHERNEVRFVMNVTGIFCDDSMLRQITESVLINKVEEGKLINSKSEWNYVSIPRVAVTL